MLSRHERDRLAEIESGLSSEDPRLVDKFDRFEPGRNGFALRRALVVLVFALLAVLISVLLVSGQLIAAVVVGAVSAVGAAACGWWARRRAGGERR